MCARRVSPPCASAASHPRECALRTVLHPPRHLCRAPQRVRLVHCPHRVRPPLCAACLASPPRTPANRLCALCSASPSGARTGPPCAPAACPHRLRPPPCAPYLAPPPRTPASRLCAPARTPCAPWAIAMAAVCPRCVRPPPCAPCSALRLGHHRVCLVHHRFLLVYLRAVHQRVALVLSAQQPRLVHQ